MVVSRQQIVVKVVANWRTQTLPPHSKKKTKTLLSTLSIKQSIQFSSVTQSCPTLCDPMNCSTPGLPVHHHLLEFTQTHVRRVGDAIQPSHPLWSLSPPTFILSQHQGLFKWISSDRADWLSLVAQTEKHLSTMWETWVRSLGQEDPLEKEMAIHSSTITWKIPWTEEPGRLQSMGLERVGHDWVISLSLICLCTCEYTFSFNQDVQIRHTHCTWLMSPSVIS